MFGYEKENKHLRRRILLFVVFVGGINGGNAPASGQVPTEMAAGIVEVV